MGTPLRGWSLLFGPKGAPGCVGKNGAVAVGHGPSAGLEAMAAGGVYKIGEVHKAIQAGHDDAHGSEAGPDDEIVDVVEIHAEFRDVIAFDPGHGIGELKTAFVNGIENAEVVAE